MQRWREPNGEYASGAVYGQSGWELRPSEQDGGGATKRAGQGAQGWSGEAVRTILSASSLARPLTAVLGPIP
jgi:hypothetical protein